MACAPHERGVNIPRIYFLVALALMAFFHYVAPLVQIFVAPLRYAGNLRPRLPRLQGEGQALALARGARAEPAKAT